MSRSKCRENLERIEEIWWDADAAYDVGEAIAKALDLRVQGGLIDTSYGPKNYTGLARVLLEEMGFDLEK